MENNFSRSVVNRQNGNRGMSLLSSLISGALHVVSIVSLLIRVAALLIRTTANCLLVVFFINPYPRWK